MTTESGIFIEIENKLSTIDITTIPNDRKKTLQPFVNYLQLKVSNDAQKHLLHVQVLWKLQTSLWFPDGCRCRSVTAAVLLPRRRCRPVCVRRALWAVHAAVRPAAREARHRPAAGQG